MQASKCGLGFSTFVHGRGDIDNYLFGETKHDSDIGTGWALRDGGRLYLFRLCVHTEFDIKR